MGRVALLIVSKEYFEFGSKKIEYEIDENGCFNCLSGTSQRSGHIGIYAEGKQYRAHRYIYQKLVGEIPDGYVVRHTCDNPKCINPAHLLTGTHAQNVRDRVERGRSAIGERNGRAKLTEQEVKEIKYIKSLNNKTLSYIYGVDQKVIRKIKRGESWKHVQI